MEKRNNVMPIFKSKDPRKLEVFHAASLQNEIRFYLNDTQYLTAIDCEEGCTIRLEEEKTEECNKKSKISIIRENLNEFIKAIFIILGISLVVSISLFFLGKAINNIFVFLIIMNIVCFIINISYVVLIECMETTPAIKSKHSAEHKMVNFLQTYKRLPKNIEEVKRASRFSPECGSREMIEGIAEDLIRSIIATIFTVGVCAIVPNFSLNFVSNEIVFLAIYFFVGFVVGKLVKKNEALSFIIKPIKKVLTNIAQCANTTRKVKDRDIILAYSVARIWLKIVYPEFYDENEDTFGKKYLEVINN